MNPFSNGLIQFLSSGQIFHCRRLWIQSQELAKPLWTFSFPWQDWPPPFPSVGDELRVTLDDGRTAQATVKRIHADLTMAETWIDCVGTEPLAQPTN